MKSLFSLLLLTLASSLIIPTTYGQARFEDEKKYEKAAKLADPMDEDMLEEVKRRFLSDSENLVIVHGDYEMREGSETESDILVINGTMTVAGTVTGSVVVTNGNIHLKEGGSIGKNAIVINGKMIVENSRSVGGKDLQLGWSEFQSQSESMGELKDEMESLNKEMKDLAEEMRLQGEELRSKGKEFSATFEDRQEDRDMDEVESDEVDWKERWNSFGYKAKTNNDFLALEYNRVNGLLLGGKIDKNHKQFRNKPFQIYGQLAYSFGLDRADYQFGVNKFFGKRYRLEIGGEFYDQLRTNDHGLVGNGENTVNALLFKRDFRDYFLADGFSLHVTQSLNQHLKLTGEYRNDVYTSAPNQVNWAVFRSQSDFRENPVVDEGRMVTLSGRVEFNNVAEVRVGRKIHKRRGWQIAAEAERSYTSMNSDFHYSRYTASAVHYLPLSRWENLDTRVMAGSATGDVPYQKEFFVGGISTLRGHAYKEFVGNQMLMSNVEYRIHSGRFSGEKILFLPFSVILFADAGYVWNHPIYSVKELARGVRLNDVETDLGIGFGEERDLFRIDFAKSVSGESNYKVNVRLNYAF